MMLACTILVAVKEMRSDIVMNLFEGNSKQDLLKG